jgi:DNA-binding transcriptional ArsR family regulator
MIDISPIAAVVGEPARARMLTALMEGRALTATELALAADVSASTASSHLTKLAGAGLIALERQGRHRYFRLSGPEVADAIERLMGLAARVGRARAPAAPASDAVRRLRSCYDHLAGERAVELFEALRAKRRLIERHGAVQLSAEGEALVRTLGIDPGGLTGSRRPLCRACLDWSERKSHLGGALGAAILARFLSQRWARRELGSRALILSPEGERRLASLR